jgi:hypothetical protein
MRRRKFIMLAGGAAITWPLRRQPRRSQSFSLSRKTLFRLGLVDSLARPGENVTGINFLGGELVAKRLEVLRELVPAVALIGVLVNPTQATNTETALKDVTAAADGMGLRIQVFNASNGHEIEATFAGFLRERPDAQRVTEQPQLRVFEGGLNRPTHASPPWRPLEQARRMQQKREAAPHEAVECHGPRRWDGEHGFWAVDLSTRHPPPH